MRRWQRDTRGAEGSQALVARSVLTELSVFRTKLSLQRQSSRQRKKARNIWIDAVSNNQADSTEKEHQIRLMEKIYSSAEQTFIWPGDAADYSALAKDLVSTILDTDFENYNAEDSAWKALYELFQRQ
ncbi:hypothetical protein W97_08923 [Coniosporium apollinis CBS 100218]|uniref:Heterokaryon incompatibility domain-containing protein n=1 Tax=Coniosporium apollinis (strain CBS 100218) TaxID=1168221 RepID=R7Z6Y1_CONA1|nr:uncharacterized protein W97_08923 [Coniosporium apollinis CBS 100218]EON69671.1 hypothetical protein W97_08923 [Coniosporium apollinis CBS 100218]